MVPEVQGTSDSYYEVLRVAENASFQEIQAALAAYRTSQEEKLGNPLTMGPARSALNVIVPAIERFLLSDDNARMEYDRQLAASRRKQTEGYEPADDEGLDDPLRMPFLFNPLEDFDTEIPGHTLRFIAMKLDSEWASARTWITDSSDETHSFISYLTIVANRKNLAERIGHIIEAVAPHNKWRMDTNEGIERCINILDPHIERPRVGIHNLTFDGKTLDAGTFISDLPARTDLILGHEGVRGCAFGVIESHTNWLTFEQGRSSVRFSLMPEGTEPAMGASEVKIPLFFNVGNFMRNASHTALLIIRMENQARVIEQPVQVVIYVQPLPPRVMFEPEASQETPVWAGIVRRGMPASVMVTPRNYGDEGLIPLAARISTDDTAARARPGEFHANEPVTITIDTSNRPFGEKYTIAFAINYLTPGAQGPTTIYVQGETLPTSWQSMLREKGLGERVGAGCLVGLVGWALFGAFGAGLAAHVGFAWLLFLAIPLLFVLAAHSVVTTGVMHIQRAGNPNVRIEDIPLWKLWGIPVAVGLVVALIYTLLPGVGSSFFIAGLVGFILGAAFGFVQNKAGSANMNTTVPPTS